MSEPSVKGGKTRPQLNSQIDRIWNMTNEAYLNSRTNEERQRIVKRYNRASNIYAAYMDAMNNSPQLMAGLNRYAKANNGSLSGPVAEYLDKITVPRSVYMRRKNNRRG